MEENYCIFFQRFKEFCLVKNLGELSGLSNEAINVLERQLEVSFPLALKMYLRYIGEKIQLPNCSIPNATRVSLIQAELQAKEKDIRSKIKNLKIVNEWDRSEIEDSIDQICFINWVDYNGYFSFVKLDDEYSNIYGWDYDEMIYKWENNLIGSIRKQMLLGLIRIVKQSESNLSSQDQLFKRLNYDQIIMDKKMVENVSVYNIRVLKEENLKKEFIDVETYIENYIVERMNSSV